MLDLSKLYGTKQALLAAVVTILSLRSAAHVEFFATVVVNMFLTLRYPYMCCFARSFGCVHALCINQAKGKHDHWVWRRFYERHEFIAGAVKWTTLWCLLGCNINGVGGAQLSWPLDTIILIVTSNVDSSQPNVEITFSFTYRVIFFTGTPPKMSKYRQVILG